MPRYKYRCKACQEMFEVSHSITFNGQTCTKCSSKEVIRIPYEITLKTASPSKPKAPGAVVNEYIKDAKQEIKDEKKHLKNRSL